MNNSIAEEILYILIALLAARAVFSLVDQIRSSGSTLSHDEMVRVLQEVYDSSPRIQNIILDSLSNLDSIEQLPGLTPFQKVLVTIWLVYAGWLGWKAADLFL